MNRIAASTLAIGLLLPFTLGGCSGQPSATSAKPSAVTAAPPLEPELWLDKEAAEMFKAVLGYSEWDEVYVIRWKNCEQLHGWVKLDGKGGSEPASHDLTILPKDTSTGNAVLKHRDFGMSGWVVVTMRNIPDTPGRAYDVRVEQGYTQKYIPVDGHDVSQEIRVEPGASQHHHSMEARFREPTYRGKLLREPSDPHPDKSGSLTVSYIAYGSVGLQKSHEGRTVSWLELRIDPTASVPKK